MAQTSDRQRANTAPLPGINAISMHTRQVQLDANTTTRGKQSLARVADSRSTLTGSTPFCRRAVERYS